MKKSKLSALLRILALALSLLVLCGSLPVSALDELPTDEPAETIAQETAEPTEAEEAATESPEIPDEVAETVSDSPTEDITDGTEAVLPSETEAEPITVTVYDAEKHKISGSAAAGLSDIEVVIKRNGDSDDKDLFSVVFVSSDEYSSDSLDSDNLIPGVSNDTKADWVELWRSQDEYNPRLKFTDANAPEFTDGEYTLAVRDGLGNVVTKNILLLTQAPTISLSAVPSGWQNEAVKVYAYVSDHVESVFYTDAKNGETHTADYYAKNTYVIEVGEYSAAGRYSFTAVDEAGNTSDKKEVLESEIKIDTHDPAVQIIGYSDGKNDIYPEKTWLNKNSTVYAVVRAEDKDGDKMQSGIDPDSFELDGKKANFTKDGDDYLIELAEPTKVKEITVRDHAKNISNKAKTEAFQVDTTAPSVSDFQVFFSADDSPAGKLLSTLSFGLYFNQKIYMTVKVNSNGQSDIAAISAKDNDKLLEGGEITDEGLGVFSVRFELPVKDENDKTAYDITFEATDAVGNDSAPIALSDVKQIAIKDQAIEEGSALYEVVVTNQAPYDSAFKVMQGRSEAVAVDQYYTTADGKEKVSLTVSDPLAGLENDVRIYFGKNEDFEIKDDQYTKLPDELTDVSKRDSVYGTGELSGKRVAQQVEFELSDRLASGTYTVLMVAENYAGNTAYLRKEIKVDNSGPVLSDATLSPDSWTNKEITVTFKAKDDYVGIHDKDVTVTKPDGGTLTPKPNGDGTYSFTTKINGTYTASAVDKLGNPSNEFEITVDNYDDEAPVIKITKYDPDGDKNWTESEVKVTFEVTDNSKASVNLAVDDGSTIHPEPKGNGEYWFIANKNRAYTITATDEAENTGIAKTAEIKFDNQPSSIEKVVFSAETGNFKKFGIYDNKIITATVYVRSPGNAPISDIVLKDGSVLITPDGKVEQDKDDKNLYYRTFPLKVSDKAYDLSVEATNESKLETTQNIENLPLYFDDDKETGRLVEEEYKAAFELVVTEHKPAIDFINNIEGYTSEPDESGKHEKVFAGAGGGTVSAHVIDDLSGVKDIVSVQFDGTDVTANYHINENEKETDVEIRYTFDGKLASGEHTLTIKAVNNAGNSKEETYSFYLDQTPPTGSYSAPKVWTNRPITVTVNVNDNADGFGYYSGIEDVKVDGGAVKIDPQGDGIYTFTAESRRDYEISMTDKLGNSDAFTVSAEDIWFDDEAPELVNNKFNYDNTNWVNEKDGIFVSFVLTDDLSGVDTDSIVITGDSNGEIYSGREDYSCKKNLETGEVTCSFRADYYQTYTVTVTDSVTEEDENKAIFTTPDTDKPKVDGIDPEIESVTFESAASAGEKILNILSFGLYSNKDIKMTVKAKDAAPSSGIAAITAKYNDSVELEARELSSDEPSGDKEVTATRAFIIKTDSAAYDPEKILLQVTDNVGHDSEVKSAAETDKYVVYPNAESAVSAPVEDGFEIVASNEKPDIGVIVLTGNGEHTVKDNVWFKGEKDGTEVTVTSTITADLTKLHDIRVYLNDTEITEQVNGAGQITDFDTHSGEAIPSKTISFSTGTLDHVNRASSGNARNVVKIVAVGNNGETAEASKTFYIDDTTPEITSVKFESAQTAADAVLNVLTFGLYSNDKIKMTVAAADDITGNPSSGIQNISVTNKGNGSIKAEDFTPTDDNTGGSTDTERVFIIDKSDLKYDPSKIEFDVTDHVGNSAQTVTAASLNQDGKLFTKDSETAKIFDEEKFEIVSTSKAPDVSKITLTAQPEPYTDASGKVWYQGDDTDEVGMSFTAEDTLSKLHSVKAEINGNNIINEVYTNFEGEAANTPDGKDAWETDGTYTANTAQSDVTGYLNRISESASANRFTVEVYNNSSISTNVESDPFYIDDAVPYITEFAFEGDGFSDVYADDENGGLNPADVELTEYGFYFKSTTDVTVTASDFVEKSNAQGSGVKYIGFRFVDINGRTYDYGEREVDENNQATFTVNADFKGQIFAYAVDNVTNKGSEITPDGLIVESGSAHTAGSGASIEFGQTNYRGKDNNGIDLFSGDVTVTFMISDTVSGLRDAYYTVTNGSQVVDFRRVNVSNSGTLDNSSWRISEREAGTNLVTRMTLTDTISAASFNANNLVVTVIAHDRAGYTIESRKSLSIDITNPKIEITFNPADPVNTDSGNNYYSTTRTATITVTERNFDPADFDWSKMIAIEGTVPSYAAGANWSTSYSDYTDNSQHTATVTFADDGKYEVILNFTDMAGNKADQVDAGQFYIDKTVPTISVSYSPDTEYYSGTVTATVTIVEHNFNPDSKYLTFTPHYFAPDQTTVKSGPSLSGWSTNGDTHTATLSFSEDGKYAFDIAFNDMALNAAQSYTGKTFYVDQTKPVITFGQSIQNGHAYDIQVQPEFDVFDFNYAGAESVQYTLTRHYYDFASGKQTSTVIDSSAVRPEYIEGVIKQLFTYPLFAKTEDNDGVYVLSVSATDRAGNVSDPASLTFSVNCFGSVFLLASDETVRLAESGYTSDAPDILIKEINVNQLKEQSMTLSYNNSNQKLEQGDYTITSSGGGDEWYEYLYKISADLFEKEGSYTVTASSVDSQLGTVTTNRTVNTVEGEKAVHKNCPVSFIVDKTPPSVTISGVEENGAYSEAERELQITCLDDNLDKDSVVLKINGETVDLKENEIDDSLVGQLDINYTILASGQQTDYRVEVEAKDYAGVTGSGSVDKFTLSATWLTMFFHNTTAVIITSVVLAALIALAIILIVKKRRQDT